MQILVAYASRHGSTKGIAGRIGDRLRAAGLKTDVVPVKAVRDLAVYDAFVLGSALYMFHWMKEARSFAGRNRGALTRKPIWLFSSGPIEALDKQGRDPLRVSGPKEVDELREMLHPRDHQVFFGAWDRLNKPIGFTERVVSMMPAARAAFPNSDLRDWSRIEAWADGIAQELLKGTAS
ncbi:MAG: flavodoxin domain-containing protein [Candidatus Limnocylindrales bacterium]